MSNAGQAVLGVVGGIIGFYVGGPTGAAYGFQLGLLAGSALFPTQLPGVQGPRLGDGQPTVSTVGSPIPWVHGRQRVGGIVIWAGPISEEAVTQTAGGKGSPEQETTTFQYRRSYAVLLCECEPGRPIGGVSRVWHNGKIVYDITDRDTSGFNTMMSNAVRNTAFENQTTLYLGTEDQLPDPTIESHEGVGNVPGFRGYAYIVYDEVLLLPEDGNRMPASMSFEIYEEGTLEQGELNPSAQEVLYRWGTSYLNPADDRNFNTYRHFETVHTDLRSALAEIATLHGGDGRPSYQPITHKIGQFNMYPTIICGGVSAFFGGNFSSTATILALPDGVAIYDTVVPDVSALSCRFLYQMYFDCLMERQNTSVPEPTGVPFNTPPPLGYFDNSSSCMGEFGTFSVYYIDAQPILVERHPVPPPNPRDVGAYVPQYDAYVVNGILYPDSDWQFDPTQYLVLQRFEEGDGNTMKYPLPPALKASSPLNTQATWVRAYNRAAAQGLIPGGLSYGIDYPVPQDGAYRMPIGLSSVITFPISLATVVSRICNRVSERLRVPFYYDVSDLEDVFIIGYQTSRLLTARGALEPLRQVGFFDVVESGIQMKFPRRGKAPVFTWEENDIGAHFLSEQREPNVTTKMLLELELPRQIRVNYQNPLRDLDPGEELSPSRSESASENVINVELAVAMETDQAAQAAEVLFRDTWASRWLHSAQTDLKWAHVEPGDCGLIPSDDKIHRVRVASVIDRLPNIRQFELVRDDDGAYVSTAVGSDPQIPPEVIDILGPVGFVVLDVPPLDLTRNAADLYVATYPEILDGVFRGAIVQRSTDGGSTFTTVATTSRATAVGTILTPAGEGPTTVFDETNEIIVEMVAGTLESRPEIDIFNGANAAAVGVHGRWEIIQFRDADLLDDDFGDRTYRLTGLMRGRRGTEHNIGTGASEDQFVFLDVAVVRLSVAEIGASILYRASPPNSSAISGPVELISDGQALKPFSPVQIEGQRDSEGNVEISWVRRDRLSNDADPQVDPIPMSETVEDYEIDVLDEDLEVRRTISTSNSFYTYTTEQQIDDFGEVQPSINIAIYQISTAVGRGHPGTAVL